MDEPEDRPQRRLKLAESVALPPPETPPVRLDPAIEQFVRSDHFQPVIRALRRAVENTLNAVERNAESTQFLTFYSGATQGLRGFIKYLMKHSPQKEK